MRRTNRVVVLGRGPGRAAAAAACLGEPGVVLIGDAVTGGGWTDTMRELRRLEVDVTRFRPGNDPDEIPLARHVTTDTVANADVLLADLSLPPETVRAALYHARGKVVLEPGPSLTWATTFAPFVHALVPAPATLSELSSEAETPGQARDLAERLRVTVVVPLAPARALLARPGQEPELIETASATAVPDPGQDRFRGVLAALLAGKTPLAEAVRTAVHTTASGPVGALPA